MIRRGFTLIEMLVATVLFAVLMTAVLFVVSGLSRDRAVLAATVAAPRPQAIVDLLRFDLGNAETMLGSRSGDMLVLVGHGGIHPETLTATGRLSRITYRIEQAGSGQRLIREQRYVDDRAQPQPWREVVATNVQRLHVLPASFGAASPTNEDLVQFAGRGAIQVPPRVLVRLQRGRNVINEELQVR